MSLANNKLEKIKQLLSKISPIVKENDKEFQIRCPYCGDSKKSPYRTHMYISKESPHPFICFRAECEAKGKLIDLLQDFNLLQELDFSTLQELYKNGSSSQKFNLKINTNKLNLFENNSEKLQYIRNRLAIVNDIPDWLLKHIVCNYSKIPYIDNYTKEILNKYYVGFKTVRNRLIINRRITNDEKLIRYRNIYLSNDRKIDYFVASPSKDIDLTTNDGIVIVGEGVFDVVNGFYHLAFNNLLNSKNIILVASNGKHYGNALRFVINKYLVSDWNYYVLLDSDISLDIITKQFRNYKIPKNHSYLLKNKIDKDFGSKDCKPQFIQVI